MTSPHLLHDNNTADVGREAPSGTERQTPTPIHTLLPHHRDMLDASAISEDVIVARGYRSVTTKAELRRLGFSPSQVSTPTLLVPIWSVSGDIGLYHHRPDVPRIRDGKPAKYEFPARSHMVVDVHPSIRDQVRDPSVPLFITEGVKKADAAISLGLACIGLIGTWNWRGTNEYGGKTALPDWDAIALKDREGCGRLVYICYDSDVMLKPQVHQALVRLSEFLKSRGAHVLYIYLPSGAAGAKVGLDDYIAAGHTKDDLLAHATTEIKPPPRSSERGANGLRVGLYTETEHGIIYHKPTQNGSVEQPLTNFTARIEREIVVDDGAETTLTFEVSAQLGAMQRKFSVPALAFTNLNWAIEQLGAGAIVYPGQTVKDHTRVAIQSLSGHVPRNYIYQHTGWRNSTDDNGGWVFQHGGGAVGDALRAEDQGNSPSCQLPGPLQRYVLPNPPEGEEARAAIRASLGMWDVGPDHVTIPIWCAAYRAVIGMADFSIWLVGPTGVFKTELAALAQQHFGAQLDARHLPAAWSSTANALEGLAFSAKDALMVIDDYVPVAGRNANHELQAKAERVLRAQGNASGRQRMRSDSTLRPPKPPRGIILGTGEDTPAGQSLKGRMLILELSKGDTAPNRLTKSQHHAASELYAQSMAGFLAWMAPSYEETRGDWQELALELRDEVTGLGHARTPGIVAELGATMAFFLSYAVEAGALTREEGEALRRRAWKALRYVGSLQAHQQAANEPASRYIELLRQAIASGRAHIAPIDGITSSVDEAYGWEAHKWEYSPTEWKPRGDRIGYRDTESGDLYLLPDASYNVARSMGEAGGAGLVISAQTLRKRLKEAGLLVSTDEARETLTVRRTLGGAQHNILHLKDFISPTRQEPDKPDRVEPGESIHGT